GWRPKVTLEATWWVVRVRSSWRGWDMTNTGIRRVGPIPGTRARDPLKPGPRRSPAPRQSPASCRGTPPAAGDRGPGTVDAGPAAGSAGGGGGLARAYSRMTLQLSSVVETVPGMSSTSDETREEAPAAAGRNRADAAV